MELSRIIIYTKDIERITGKSNRYSRRILKRIMAAYGKKKHQMITLGEFCEYMNFKIEEIAGYLS